MPMETIDEYLNALTEIELETKSKAIFHLCETVRDSELFKNERETLESFIAWASGESLRFNKSQDAPRDEEILP
jgi:hypothetical protein